MPGTHLSRYNFWEAPQKEKGWERSAFLCYENKGFLNKIMIITSPLDQGFPRPCILLERLSVTRANPIAGIPTAPVFTVQTPFSLGTFSVIQKSNLRRSRNSLRLELLCPAAYGWGISQDLILISAMHWIAHTDSRSPVPYRGNWHVTVWSQWQQTTQSSLQVDRSTHCTSSNSVSFCLK